MNRLILGLLLVLVTYSNTASGATWYVPSPVCPTIRAAIDTASAGDAIVVADGVYHEGGFRLKPGLRLRSETGHPTSCIIDANGSRAFICENITASVRGFTIQNGAGDLWGAGAILGITSSLKVTNCIFSANVVPCDPQTGPPGGALRFLQNSTLTVDSCTFFDNSAGWAGAIGVESSHLDLADCFFQGNATDSAFGANGWGGAVSFNGSSGAVVNCRFYNNSTPGDGGALYACLSTVALTGCTFFGNTAVSGGAILGIASTLDLSNCTMVGNSASYGGGVRLTEGSSATLNNTIIAFSILGTGIGCQVSSIPTLSCCDVYGNAGGDWAGKIADQYGIRGNISADPQFCGELSPAEPYRLMTTSPCSPDSSGACGLIGAWPVGCIAPPVASFEAVPASGTSPLQVTFTDASSGQIDSWHWDFGNGSQFDGENPPPQDYETDLCDEQFTATLTVAGPGGSDDYSTVLTAWLDCDDGDSSTFDFCDGAADECRSFPVPLPGNCIMTCDDHDICTFDFCDPETDQCLSLELPGCSPDDCPLDCDDNDPCTFDYCAGGKCLHVPTVECEVSFEIKLLRPGQNMIVPLPLMPGPTELHATVLQMGLLAGHGLLVRFIPGPLLTEGFEIPFQTASDPGQFWEMWFGGVLQYPAIVVFTYDDDLLVSGVDERQLGIYQFTGGNWESIEGDVDTTANTVACEVEALSLFGLGERDDASGLGGPVCVPAGYKLHQGRPNPFSASTVIRYELPERAGVNLRVYDVSGRAIRVLVDSRSQEAGRHEVQWDGCDASGGKVSSGIYFCRIEAGAFARTERMVLTR